MTPWKVNNHTTEDLTDSEVDGISNIELIESWQEWLVKWKRTCINTLTNQRECKLISKWSKRKHKWIAKRTQTEYK
jgi:hypothetical protein